MAASIESKINGASALIGVSRGDPPDIEVRSGDVITVTSVGGPATTFGWSLLFTPDAVDGTPSTATLSATVGPGPVTFTVDNEGSYLVRLIVDFGLGTESEQTVRVRALTVFENLRLVAGGEKRDQTGTIPVDASPEGWADDQNRNLQILLGLIEHVSSSGRIIYVDANRGKDSSDPPNDPTIAEGFADFSTVGAAIAAAIADPAYNGGVAPSNTAPVIVAVRPGLYVENLVFKPYVHIIGWPATGGFQGNTSLNNADQSVRIRTLGGGFPQLTHEAQLTNAGEFVMVSNLQLENTATTTNALLRKTGVGSLHMTQVRLFQNGNGAGQGAALNCERGSTVLDHCTLVQNATFADDLVALEVGPTGANTASLQADWCRIHGTSAAIIDSSQVGGAGTFANFFHTDFKQVGLGPSSFCVDTFAPATRFDLCGFQMENAAAEALRGNPGGVGTPGDMRIFLRRSEVGPTGANLGIDVDDTGVTGTAELALGSSEYGTLTLGGTVVQTALTLGTSLFYDNTTSGITAENVQDAIDQIFAVGESIANLDDAYDGFNFATTPPTRLVGGGRVIIADANAVEIHGAGVSTAPPIINDGSGDGTLRVKQGVEVGAINSPEIIAQSNDFGGGPFVGMGRNIWTDSPLGASAYIVGTATGDTGGADTFRNYNLRVQTQSGVGQTMAGPMLASMGALVLQAGGSYALSGMNSPDGGSVYLIAGHVDSTAVGAGAAGNVWIMPGLSQAAGSPTSGTFNIIDSTTATPATLTGFSNFVDSGAPAGTVTFATDTGGITITFAGAEIWGGAGGIQELLSSGTGMIASWPGGATPITLTSTGTGPTAELVQTSDTGGVNVFLGDFSLGGGGSFVAGTAPDFVSISATGPQEITIGDGTADLIYNGVTGKLTVPGLLDPTALIYSAGVPETSLPAAPGTGEVFVTDGTGGAPGAGKLYYRDTGGTLFDLTAAAGGGAPLGSRYVISPGAPDATLTAERILTNTGDIVWTDGGAGGPMTADLAVQGGVVPGAYTTANVTVNSKGIITAVASGVAGGASSASSFVIVGGGTGDPSLTEERILSGDGGVGPFAPGANANISITDLGIGSPVRIDLVATAVTPGTYSIDDASGTTIFDLAVDQKGRLTDVNGGTFTATLPATEHLISRQMLIPIGAAPGSIVQEWDILSFATTTFTPTPTLPGPTAAHIYYNGGPGVPVPLGPGGAVPGDVLLDIVAAPTGTPPTSPADSIIGGPIPIGATAPGTIIPVPVISGPLTLGAPDMVIGIIITYVSTPVGPSDGLVVSIHGTTP